MATIIHDLKDGIDQILELGSIIERRLQMLPESDDRAEALEGVGKARDAATAARIPIANLSNSGRSARA